MVLTEVNRISVSGCNRYWDVYRVFRKPGGDAYGYRDFAFVPDSLLRSVEDPLSGGLNVRVISNFYVKVGLCVWF